MNYKISKVLWLVIVFGCTTFFACRKDKMTPAAISLYNLGLKTQADFHGMVVDENHNPIPQANIIIGGKKAITAIDGSFVIPQAEVFKDFAYAKIEKSGYFLGTRTLGVNEGASNYVEVMLLEKKNIGIVSAVSGGELEFESVQIQLPANGFMDANGFNYSGEVYVAAKYLDPTAPSLGTMMPGDLVGFNLEYRQVGLITFGMIAVELTDKNGELLQLNGAAEAIINVPIPASLQSQAAPSIPLWHFDETMGVWIEEGSAVLENNRYVGKVKHFSFWNFDVPVPLVQISGTVLNNANTALEGFKIEVGILNMPFQPGARYTDNNGGFIGKVPADVPLVLRVVDPRCGAVLATQNIGSFSEDAVLPPIIITFSANSFLELSFRFKDCDGNPLSNGYAVIDVEGYSMPFLIDGNGQLSETIYFCSPQAVVSVSAYDLDKGNTSSPFVFNIVGNVLGSEIIVCNEVSEYFSFHFRGERKMDENPTWFYIDNTALYHEPDPNEQLNPTIKGNFTLGSNGLIDMYYMSFQWPNESLGTFPIESFRVVKGTPGHNFKSGIVTILSYEPNADGLISGSYTIQLEDNSNPVLLKNSTGSFKVKKQ